MLLPESVGGAGALQVMLASLEGQSTQLCRQCRQRVPHGINHLRAVLDPEASSNADDVRAALDRFVGRISRV